MVQESHITVLRDLLQKIGLELAFISTGGDEGKNNLHHLLQRFLTNIPQDIPAELCSILQNALEKTAEDIPLTEDLINYFNIWHPWLEEALSSLSHALPLPTIPSALMTEVNKAELNPDPEENQSVTVLPDGADQELMRLFCAESEELLQDIEQGVLRLEKDPNDTDTLATVFRAFHTFKGNAAVMKLVVLQKLAHELESLLDSARRGDYQLDRNAIDAILLGADIFSKYVLEASQQLEGKNVGAALMLPIPTVVNRIRSAFAVKNKPLAHPLPEPQPTTLRSPKETVVVEQITDLTPNTQQNAEKQPSSGEVSSPPTPPPNIKHLTSQSIRVDTQKLDGLVDLVGELVIAQSLVSRGAESHGSDEHLSRSLSQLRGITSDLHRTAMALRMIPIRNTFQKMSRVVRDLSDQLGKTIELVIEGEETELDRTVIEEIGDPLMHMIRNAADHGIESSEQRSALGKPISGTITLRARHEGGIVVIEIKDDGHGLDPAKLRQKAIEKGIIQKETPLDDHEALNLIFAPGFSTAESVSDLSGRGVGMDVVRRNIEKLRGTVEIHSTIGDGTTFTIFLPLTLAIIEGLLVAVGDQQFILPAVSVRESFQPQKGDLTQIQGKGELVDVRGQLLPLLRLGRYLSINTAVNDPDQAIVVVIEAGNDCRCLLVDGLIGRQEVVIKSLGETFCEHGCFAGAAILGDGRVGLILDTTALVRLSMKNVEDAA